MKSGGIDSLQDQCCLGVFRSLDIMTKLNVYKHNNIYMFLILVKPTFDWK